MIVHILVGIALLGVAAAILYGIHKLPESEDD